MELHATQVNLTGLLEVLGRNLYSTPDVVLRELIQNAHDSCTRRRLEDSEDFEPAIHIATSQADASLTISDNGAGLTETEIGAYLATIGTGYSGKLRRDSNSNELIGEFGLGFLSAYVVAERVEFWSASYQTPSVANRFVSNGGERYSVSAAPQRPVGSRVKLQLQSEFKHLADPIAVQMTLERYCALLDIPVVINNAPQPVNFLDPPWRSTHSPNSAAYRRLADAVVDNFETRFGALCTLPVAPTADSDSRGMLWLHDGSSYATSDNRNLSIFVRGMLISDKERNLLPPWAGFVGGVIESTSLIPTASRESLKEDEHFKVVADQVTEALISGLSELPTMDRERWQVVSKRHNEALLGAALSDDRLFDALGADLRVPTTEGDLSVDAILQRGATKIHITSGAQRGPEELIFRALRIPIVLGERFGALAFTTRYAAERGVDCVILGTGDGNRQIFKASECSAEQNNKLIELFAGDYQVSPVSFAPQHIPLIVLLDRDALIKQRLEADAASTRIAPAALQLARMHTAKRADKSAQDLFINTASPLIHRLLALHQTRQTLFAGLLLAFANCTAATEHDEGDVQLDKHLAAFSANLLTLIGEGQ